MSKIKKVIILADVHLTQEVPDEYKVVKKFIKSEKPDEIVLLGDYMDIESLSAWDRDKRMLMEGRRHKIECDVANRELDFLQKYAKKVTFLEGNHEWRVRRYLEKNPEMIGMIELPMMLNLEKRGINWYPINELYDIGKMSFTHGIYTTKYHANKHLSMYGCNICYGHKHEAQTYLMNMKMQKPYMAYAMPCLCDKQPDYMQGKPTNWINGFGIMYVDEQTGEFNLYPVMIVNKQFIWEGKKYEI